MIRDDFSKGGLENLSGTDLILNIVNILKQKATKVSILTSVAMKTNAKIYEAMEKSLFFEIVLNEILNPIYDSVFKSQVHSHHELKHFPIHEVAQIMYLLFVSEQIDLTIRVKIILKFLLSFAGDTRSHLLEKLLPSTCIYPSMVKE